MSYTFTFDASHKVKGANGTHVKNFIEHIARDVDEANGKKPVRRRSTIQSRTKYNETTIADGRGGFRPAKSVHEFKDALKARLDTVTKTIRKDAVVLRPLVVHIGREWYEEHCPQWREGILTPEAVRLHEIIMSGVQELYGVTNVLGRSLHVDEFSPQLQIMLTTVTEDGRLSQQDFFPGAEDLVATHNFMRQRLIDAGFDVGMDRTTKDRAPENMHIPNDVFRDAAEHLERQNEKLDAKLSIAQRDLDKSRQDRQAAKIDQTRAVEELAEVRNYQAATEYARSTVRKQLDDREDTLNARDVDSARKATEAAQMTAAAQEQLERARSAYASAQRRADTLIREAESKAVTMMPDPQTAARAIRGASPDLWIKFLQKAPKVAEMFDKWAYREVKIIRASEGKLNAATHGRQHDQAEHMREVRFRDAGVSEYAVGDSDPSEPSVG